LRDQVQELSNKFSDLPEFLKKNDNQILGKKNTELPSQVYELLTKISNLPEYGEDEKTDAVI